MKLLSLLPNVTILWATSPKGFGTQQIPEYSSIMTVRTNCACSEHPHYSVLAHLTDDLSYDALLKTKIDLRHYSLDLNTRVIHHFTVNLLDKLHCKIHHRQCGRSAWKLRMGREIEGERFLSVIWNLNLDSYGKHPSLSQRGQGICHMSKIFHSNNSLGSLLEQVNALLHKEKSCTLKYLRRVSLPLNIFFSQCNWAAYVIYATMVGFLLVKYSPKPTACSSGGSSAHQMLFH